MIKTDDVKRFEKIAHDLSGQDVYIRVGARTNPAAPLEKIHWAGETAEPYTIMTVAPEASLEWLYREFVTELAAIKTQKEWETLHGPAPVPPKEKGNLRITVTSDSEKVKQLAEKMLDLIDDFAYDNYKSDSLDSKISVLEDLAELERGKNDS